MSRRARRTLRRLSKSIRENVPQINKRLAKVGVNPDPALVFSAAKYYRALNRLAKA
jgi:hypothetical protein